MNNTSSTLSINYIAASTNEYQPQFGESNLHFIDGLSGSIKGNILPQGILGIKNFDYRDSIIFSTPSKKKLPIPGILIEKRKKYPANNYYKVTISPIPLGWILYGQSLITTVEPELSYKIEILESTDYKQKEEQFEHMQEEPKTIVHAGFEEALGRENSQEYKQEMLVKYRFTRWNKVLNLVVDDKIKKISDDWHEICDALGVPCLEPNSSLAQRQQQARSILKAHNLEQANRAKRNLGRVFASDKWPENLFTEEVRKKTEEVSKFIHAAVESFSS